MNITLLGKGKEFEADQLEGLAADASKVIAPELDDRTKTGVPDIPVDETWADSPRGRTAQLTTAISGNISTRTNGALRKARSPPEMASSSYISVSADPRTKPNGTPPRTERSSRVDLGIENLAVTSTASFFSGRELTHRLREFEKVRAGLQQTGTRSAHRTLTQSSGRELRYVREVLHRASNALIDEALRYDCDVIAFENLTHIRDRTGASWGHKWAFRTLYEYVEYKAESVGISVKQVGSAYTSQRCSECGFTVDENRPSRNDFQCVKCGSEANADYNAVVRLRLTGSKREAFATAKNIGMRYVRRGQQSSRRTGDSQLALKSGTVKPKRGFTAYPDGFEAEFTDKPHHQKSRTSG